MKSPKTGIIILAAGNSSRLGKPKQLLKFQGKSLVQRAIETATKTNAQGSVLILGANLELILTDIRNSKVNVVINKNWKEGMASGMQKGLEYMEKKLAPDQVIMMLCDQPFVNSDLLNSLIEKQKETGKGIVACQYNDILGVPVLFTKMYFKELGTLKGSEGAKKVLYSHQDDLAQVEFPEGAIDIDTLEDYEKLTKEN